MKPDQIDNYFIPIQISASASTSTVYARPMMSTSYVKIEDKKMSPLYLISSDMVCYSDSINIIHPSQSIYIIEYQNQWSMLHTNKFGLYVYNYPYDLPNLEFYWYGINVTEREFKEKNITQNLQKIII